MIKPIVIFAMAAVTANTSAAEEVGAYYQIPVGIFTLNSGVTSETGKLMIYDNNDGSTGIQLITLAERDTLGFLLQRGDVPANLSEKVFGSETELCIPYWPERRSSDYSGFQAFDLLTEEGESARLGKQLLDVTGHPLTNIALSFSGEAIIPGRQSTETLTGSIRPSPRGFVPIVESDTLMSFTRDEITYQVNATEPNLGATLLGLHKRHNYNWRGDQQATVLPFLNDWNATAPDVDIYTGQIVNEDGSPAPGAKFKVMAMKYAETNGGAGYDVAYNSFAAGPDGNFKLAFRKPDSTAVIDQMDVTIRVETPDGNEEWFKLDPQEKNILRKGTGTGN